MKKGEQMSERTPLVEPGVVVLAQEPGLVTGERLAIATNFTGVMPDLTRGADALIAAGADVRLLLAPEHGLRGTAQAGESEGSGRDDRTGLPILDTYTLTPEQVDAALDSNVDTIVFDMQDVGTRYWTYVWTMFDLLCSAARLGKRFMVLDRPNPLGGTQTSGPGVDPAFTSFVGRFNVPLRHGLTIGELAALFVAQWPQAMNAAPPDLRVVRARGWQRDMSFEDTGLTWVAPSPNMPTIDTAYAFCATGPFEGVDVSEGRGTTRPFETIGAPYVDSRLIDMLREAEVEGVTFRDTWFVPTFHKYAGQTCRGVQLHVTDRSVFNPLLCGTTMLTAFRDLYPNDFRALSPGEFEPGYALDRLWGSDELRRALERGEDARTLVPPMSNPAAYYPTGTLIYGNTAKGAA